MQRKPEVLFMRGWIRFALALLGVVANVARADVVQEAQAARRRLDYDGAAARLQAALPTLSADARARAQVALAALIPEPRDARRLLLEASRQGDDTTRRRADFELARLDYARGSYRTAMTRLEPWAEDAEARFLMAQCSAALGEHDRTVELLDALPHRDRSQALLGWSLRGRDPRRALDALESVVRVATSESRPAALLWKAECESALEHPTRAQASAQEVITRYPDSPEADAARVLLRSSGPAASPGAEVGTAHVALQVGAFEERAYALRLQESLAGPLHPIGVTVVEDPSGDLHRVQVGPFRDRAAAEEFASRTLAPRRLQWSVVVLRPSARP